jgi:cyclopropane fatty-acyl-phospholipid synthase-like methyltransferase
MTAQPPKSRDAAYFERLYAANPDPWDFTHSAYEHAKYRATLAMLEGRQVQSAFEIGCSIGVLTQMLAPQCNMLLGVDIVDAVLAQACARCAGFNHIRFENMRVPQAWPAGEKFDLIVFSEILYFLSPEDIAKAARLADENLLPGGKILLVNYTGPIEEPCGGNQAAEIFIAASEKRTAVETLRQDKYRIDLLCPRQFRSAHGGGDCGR